MKKIFRLMAFGVIVATLALPTLARATATQPSTSEQAGQDDQVKADLYKKFTDSYNAKNAKAAYDAAKEYLDKYPNDNDQIAQYLKKYIAAYEKSSHKQQFEQAVYKDKNYPEAYRLGREILAADPDNLRVLMDLGYAGVSATNTGNKSFNAEAIGYAKRAIQLIESGKQPDDWAPFANKEDALGTLSYSIGFLSMQTNNPSQAAEYLVKAAQHEGNSKKFPGTYILLAVAYQADPYKRMADDFETRFKGKPETPESKAAQENLNQVIDRIIDAYARAIALTTGTDAKSQQNKAEWMKTLTAFYKFRHPSDTDAQINQFIAESSTRPLPSGPFTPVAVPTPTPSTTPTDGSTTPGGATTSTTTTTSGAAAQPTRPATTTKSSTATTTRRP